MSNVKTEAPKAEIELEVLLDEPPQMVWRAISLPEFRETWLPKEALADPEPTSITPGEEVCYRLRDPEPPFLESAVTFQIAPNESGGTRLRILHELTDARAPANRNRPALMRAA
jgi:uncharacterized protein YndB with AHSA1/START domain